ncbi:nicotinate (nicotinamide) nucleotide adenylyltransferase [Staphylococcus ratti]|uniref:Probable nicotinate-nucleotide adenylyltransferase n=1 Tax=Staphylococcus ratti TaxID=2892440 RepID=A0ABY3PFI0_9STAP|nr:nicotinate (nicotinamide) nucleotide adenylyltransferase [Staphylococcus ratti]UEX91064.1 nicotinate (nicotinamide) nucleotide adenylyltransferase [Staphylococcus ratti]
MKKIVIYGGQFNPIHSAHEMVATMVNEAIQPDIFYFLPSYKSPLKHHENQIDVKHRIEMIKCVIENLSFGTIRYDEVERKGQSYTYDTLKIIKKEHLDDILYFVIGTDQYEQLSKWYKIDELKTFVTFIVVNRQPQHTIKDASIIQVQIPEMAISSTEIRQRRKSGKTIHMWVPLNVEHYIKREDLYG